MAKWIVQDGYLRVEDSSIQVGSESWFSWLEQSDRFSFKGDNGRFTAQQEIRRHQTYWYAYRRSAGRLLKAYLGKTSELSLERLEQASISLSGTPRLNEGLPQPDGRDEPAIPTNAPFPIPSGKITVPIPPHILVRRPRLTRQITAPLTVVSAPSGFGKSTLLQDWKQSCGFPVAWLALDEDDRIPRRFWFSLARAFRIATPEFGRSLETLLSTSTSVHIQDVIAHLTGDSSLSAIPGRRLGLVLDDFHKNNNSEILDFLQQWLAYFPPDFQLVIAGQSRPPLSLAHLRAQGRLVELEAHDLRFTLAEGIGYLQQYAPDPALAQTDLEKLVRHTEGWAAGLTLTALALSKQEDRRHFIETFSGAHIYLREYFMETVLQRSSPQVQEFLLKTAILKHLNGSLCNALTGRTDGDEILAHLWEENLFLARLEQPGWYRYHDLFSEMLFSQLQARYPHEIDRLHQHAALWYRNNLAPADAVYHLLATQAWEEAADLMEEMALRELEQFGEDSRLLRWLEELPENVVQKHRNLLFVYLRLANVALPHAKIERFVTRIEQSIAIRSAAAQTRDEREVLTEIQHVRRIWARGDVFRPPARAGNAVDARWELLNRLHLLKPLPIQDQPIVAEQIAGLIDAAQAQRNLFVLLMAGGVQAMRLNTLGQLRRSERLSRQILEHARAERGRLPEPASIALNALCRTCLERNELDHAERYLAQADEVDPNPTSTNRLVETAILRARLQAARGAPQEARATIQAMRDLHLRRPSATWTDLDLNAYEALICLRGGDVDGAEELLSGPGDGQTHHLSLLLRGEILLHRGAYAEAEAALNDFINDYPRSLAFESVLIARVPRALALFGQHKVNQALQLLSEAIRQAAPEHFSRPFLDIGAAGVPLLWLVCENVELNADAQDFTRRLLHDLDQGGQSQRLTQAEMEKLATSALISAREQQVLALLSAGHSNRELATALSISESTVKTHLANIYAKLDANGRIQAILRARELKLVA